MLRHTLSLPTHTKLKLALLMGLTIFVKRIMLIKRRFIEPAIIKAVDGKKLKIGIIAEAFQD
jgi:hypothetical protein